MSETPSRRSFLKTASTTGVLLASTRKAQAKRKIYTRKSPSSVEMIEVGVITCGEYSHADSAWGIPMNPPLGEELGIVWPRLTGMVMTMIWDPDPELAEAFAKKYDIKAVKNYYDMVDKVDAVMISDFYSAGWFPQLSKPYLEASMPVMIDRPLALSLREAKEVLDRSKKYNAPLMVPSSDEMMHETVRLRYNLKKKLDEGAVITGAMALETTNEYPAHAIHGIYKLHTVLQPKVVAVSLQADKWWEFKSAFFTMRCSHENNRDYYAGMNLTSERDTFGWLVVSTNMGRVADYDDVPGDVFSLYKNLFLPPCLEFARMIETGEMPQTHEYILEKTITFLTGFYSHCEKNGLMVNCADLPGDWRAPEIRSDRISDDIFK
ncbi:Gfo/Idh/MocA family oxidoreductase [Candidatus Latescibacterota bacterium]